MKVGYWNWPRLRAPGRRVCAEEEDAGRRHRSSGVTVSGVDRGARNSCRGGTNDPTTTDGFVAGDDGARHAGDWAAYRDGAGDLVFVGAQSQPGALEGAGEADLAVAPHCQRGGAQ